MPGSDSGSRMRRKAWKGLAPQRAAARSVIGSIARNVPISGRIMNGSMM